MKRVNRWVAEHLASVLAAMALFWVLNIVIFATLFFQRPHTIQQWLLFFVSIWFQGISLPVLALVSNLQGDRMERIQRETHDTVMAEFAEIKQMHKELHPQEGGSGMNVRIKKPVHCDARECERIWVMGVDGLHMCVEHLRLLSADSMVAEIREWVAFTDDEERPMTPEEIAALPRKVAEAKRWLEAHANQGATP